MTREVERLDDTANLAGKTVPGEVAQHSAQLRNIAFGRHRFVQETAPTLLEFRRPLTTGRDPFTLYVAGHDNIKRTMRYVHPREDAV